MGKAKKTGQCSAALSACLISWREMTGGMLDCQQGALLQVSKDSGALLRKCSSSMWVWVKIKPPGGPEDHRSESLFPFTRVPLWVPIFTSYGAPGMTIMCERIPRSLRVLLSCGLTLYALKSALQISRLDQFLLVVVLACPATPAQISQ